VERAFLSFFSEISNPLRLTRAIRPAFSPPNQGGEKRIPLSFPPGCFPWQKGPGHPLLYGERVDPSPPFCRCFCMAAGSLKIFLFPPGNWFPHDKAKSFFPLSSDTLRNPLPFPPFFSPQIFRLDGQRNGAEAFYPRNALSNFFCLVNRSSVGGLPFCGQERARGAVLPLFFFS